MTTKESNVYVLKHVGVKNSNEVEVMAILEALTNVSPYFQEKLIPESDTTDAVSWVPSSVNGPWQFRFLLNKITFLSF